MNNKQYWFPVRPARNGWGWGLPSAWQGWAVLVIFFGLLIGGLIALAPYRELISIVFSCALAGLLLAVFFWKGEPQRMRDSSSP